MFKKSSPDLRFKSYKVTLRLENELCFSYSFASEPLVPDALIGKFWYLSFLVPFFISIFKRSIRYLYFERGCKYIPSFDIIFLWLILSILYIIGYLPAFFLVYDFRLSFIFFALAHAILGIRSVTCLAWTSIFTR